MKRVQMVVEVAATEFDPVSSEAARRKGESGLVPPDGGKKSATHLKQSVTACLMSCVKIAVVHL